jgi:hypothetical protein
VEREHLERALLEQPDLTDALADRYSADGHR